MSYSVCIANNPSGILINEDSFIVLAPAMTFYSLLLMFVLAYFIVAFIDYLKPYTDRTAGITINETGIDDKISIFSTRYIPWNNVLGAKIIRTAVINLVVIFLRADREILLAQPYWKRYFLQKWKKKWGSPIVISEKRISYDILSLTKTINSKAGSYTS